MIFELVKVTTVLPFVVHCRILLCMDLLSLFLLAGVNLRNPLRVFLSQRQTPGANQLKLSDLSLHSLHILWQNKFAWFGQVRSRGQVKRPYLQKRFESQTSIYIYICACKMSQA